MGTIIRDENGYDLQVMPLCREISGVVTVDAIGGYTFIEMEADSEIKVTDGSGTFNIATSDHRHYGIPAGTISIEVISGTVRAI